MLLPLVLQGHVSGTGGGISIKVPTPQGDRIVMAPSGVQKERMRPEDMFVLDGAGEVVHTPAARPPPYKPPKLSECAPLFMSVRGCAGAPALAWAWAWFGLDWAVLGWLVADLVWPGVARLARCMAWLARLASNLPEQAHPASAWAAQAKPSLGTAAASLHACCRLPWAGALPTNPTARLHAVHFWYPTTEHIHVRTSTFTHAWPPHPPHHPPKYIHSHTCPCCRPLKCVGQALCCTATP